MMYAGRVLMTLVATVAVIVSARPNDLKAVVVDSEPGLGVSASFGGYSAKAGLGGATGGAGPAGGLYAAAESPHGSAGAGLGGSVAGGSSTGGLGAAASAPVDHASGGAAGGAGVAVHKPPVHHGQGFFDGIFNIPISVLQSVNTYLNNRGPITKPVHRRPGHHQPEVIYKTVTPEQFDSHSIGDVGAETHSEAGAGAGASSSFAAASGSEPHPPANPATAQGQGHAVLQKRVNYDDIFAIPISALKSVNHFLNGGVGTTKYVSSAHPTH